MAVFTVPLNSYTGSFLPNRIFQATSSATDTYVTQISVSAAESRSVKFGSPYSIGPSASFNNSSSTVPGGGTVQTGSIYNPTGSIGSILNAGVRSLNLETYIATNTDIPGGGTSNTYYGTLETKFAIQKSTDNKTTWTNLTTGSHNINYNSGVSVTTNLRLNYTDSSATTASFYRVSIISQSSGNLYYTGSSSGVGGIVQINDDSYFEITQNNSNLPSLTIQGTTEFLNDIIIRGTASIDVLINNQVAVSSGSNIFGDGLDDIQTLNGSIILNGPITQSDGNTAKFLSTTVSSLTSSGAISGSGTGSFGAITTNNATATNATFTTLGVTGATTLVGALTASNISASSFTGSLFGTSSWARNALTASNITPVITNNVDNRVLTATGGGTINAESCVS